MSFTESCTIKFVKRRPYSLADRGRSSITPTRKKKAPVITSSNASKSYLKSPFASMFKNTKLAFSSFDRPKENLYSWNCKILKNKIAEIRPCIVIKTALADGVQSFGFCDGESKNLDSRIISSFQDSLEKIRSFEIWEKSVLKNLYIKALAEVRKEGQKMLPHDFCVVLLRKRKLRIFNIGLSAVVVGRPAARGWEGEVRKKGGEITLQDNRNIVVICNSVLMKAMRVEEILSTAGNYWELKNPNIACWEIVEMSQIEGSLCVLIYINH